MNTDISIMLSQFGAAGLMGLLWIAERRHAALRDRQLSEAHRQIVESEREAGILIRLMRDNTRALVSLHHTQDRLCRAMERLADRERNSIDPPAASDRAASAAHAA